jgi:uncharacterized protein (DUF488 family)
MKVFTIGYEGRSLENFLNDLRMQGVDLLVDVREAPISRKPGFSKSAIADALQNAGIEYRHIRALGCPKPIRDAYKQDGDWARYTRAFMKHLDEQQAAAANLAEVCEQQATALLCYEADFTRCHRTYVARAVAGTTGATILHITDTGLISDSRPPASC